MIYKSKLTLRQRGAGTGWQIRQYGLAECRRGTLVYSGCAEDYNSPGHIPNPLLEVRGS